MPAEAPSRRLSTHDASFLYTETPTGPMHGATFSVYDGEIPFEEALEYTAARVHLVPRLRQRLAFVRYNLHHPSWEDDPDFDIRNHFVSYRLPAGSTLEEAILAGLKLAEPMLDRTRPMWKTIVLEGVRNRTVVVAMAHHCMIDGATGVEIGTLLTDLDPEAPAPEPPASAWSPAPFPAEQDLLAAAARELSIDQATNFFRQANLFLDPVKAARRALVLGQATRAAAPVFDRPVLSAPWNRAPVGRLRTLAWRKYPFALFRALRASLGGTVNDVALTVVSDAAARYLAHHRYDAAGRYFRIMVPVNVRTEGESGLMGNRVSSLMPLLPAWVMPIAERHAVVVAETTRRKESGEAQAMQLLMEEGAATPPSMMAASVYQANAPDFHLDEFAPPPPRVDVLPLLPAGFNFTVSNVPGVGVPQYMAGRRLLDSVGTIMIGGTLGFGTVVSTYNQHFYLSFTAEPRLMADVELFASFASDAVRNMAQAAGIHAVEPLPVG